MGSINKTIVKNIFKRLIDFGIILYILIILIILFTGGFEFNLFGNLIRAHTLGNPVQILLLLSLIRIIISVKIINIVLLFTSIIICLVFMEIGIRIWNPLIAKPRQAHVHRTSNTLGWELIPDAYGVGSTGNKIKVNSVGFRDVEHKIQKGKNTYRIMVVGDSFTFGMGVNLEETYAKQLERLLTSTDRPVEVINCGVIGYVMWQNVETLKQKVLPYRPDLVVLGVFLNDIRLSLPPYKENTNWKAKNPFEKKDSKIMNYFYLWNFIKNWQKRYEAKNRHRRGYEYLKGIEERKAAFDHLEPGDKKYFWYKIMHGKLEEKYYIEFAKALRNFVDIAESIGAEVIVCIIPDAAQIHEPNRQHNNRFVKKTCSQIGTPFADATTRFEQEADPKLLYLFPVDAHNSPLGHRLIAEAIAEQIHQCTNYQ
jgi:hypothetical protein